MLREGYPSSECNIVLDASLPGKYYDDLEELEIVGCAQGTGVRDG